MKNTLTGVSLALLATWTSAAQGQTCPTLIDLAPGLEPANSNPYTTFGNSLQPSDPISSNESMLVIGNTAYFGAKDPAFGFEPFQSDGTAVGTNLLADIGSPLSFGSIPTEMTDFGGALYFASTGPGIFAGGRELVRVTGPGQFEFLTNFNDSLCEVDSLTPLGGRLLFTASPQSTGSEPYAYTPGGGVTLLADVGPFDGVDAAYNHKINVYTVDTAGTTAYFFGHPSLTKRALLKTDGTPAGTVQLQEFDTDVIHYGMHAWQGHVYFEGWSAAAGYELWRTDGTVAGTNPVGDFAPGAHDAHVNLEFATEFGGALYFVMDDGQFGSELWKTDGTTAGTQLVLDLA